MRFVKVIYFDEGTAADYMQIVSGGEMKKTTEFISNISGGADVEAKAELKLDSKSKGLPHLFKTLLGFGVDTSVGGNGDIEFKKEKIAKNILENTLLSDFVELIDSDSKKKKEENKKHNSIKQFEKLSLFPQPNSFSYYMLMAPFFSMIDGNISLPSDSGECFNLDISKIEAAISHGRGYYEFISTDNDKEAIFRFSSSAFRNNYTMSDIPKMKLSVYAVNVGSIDKRNLDLTKEFEFGIDNKSRIEYNSTTSDDELSIDVFDVILAGIAE